MGTIEIIEDRQSRVVRYSTNGYQLIDGVKCFASANVNKKSSVFSISESFNMVLHNNSPIVGNYRILSSINKGKLKIHTCVKDAKEVG